MEKNSTKCMLYRLIRHAAGEVEDGAAVNHLNLAVRSENFPE